MATVPTHTPETATPDVTPAPDVPVPTKTTDAPAPVPAEASAAAAADVAPTEPPKQAEEAPSESPAKPEQGAAPSADRAVPAAAEATPAPTTEPTPTTKVETAAAPAAVPEKETKEEEEPQNALTKKFTEAEWKALKEFRQKVRSVITDAYSDSPDPKPKIIQLWGVTIDPEGPKNAKTSVILIKFLRARNLNPTSAAEMLTATLRWRDQFKVTEAIKEEFPDDVFGKLGYVYGKDKSGRPVAYNLYGANQDLKAVFGDVQQFLRWRVKMMEQSIEKLDFEETDQMVQVHDYKGVTLSSRDANSKNAASEATSIFQNHYPEFLSRKFFINVPTLLAWIFWAFKSLVSAQTFAKMSVVGSGQQAIAKALEEVIDVKEIPKRYGGEAEGF
ncbi:hypothetical protein PILCRDRAFT_812334 [Piloderma croceum F 1598]|uniref:Phosphatidylinositol transfer protein SFH5 n=1 Tax=Piloderma croceum (strain F 1598) TaxID=765440 RepID=A0A0C3GIV1_PILCF|nr:hypothetical protein PILCRDRAFT_812334 [Piloderma croceum F 1598]